MTSRASFACCTTAGLFAAALWACGGSGAGAPGGSGGSSGGSGGSSAGSGGGRAGAGIGGSSAGSGGAAAGSGGGTSAGGSAGAATGGSAGGGAGGGGTAGQSAGGFAGTSAGGQTGQGPCAAAGLWLCDDFEAAAAGSEPGAPLWKPQSADQGDRIKIDGSQHHSGSKSVTMMASNRGTQMIPASFTPVDNSFYIRVYMRLSKSTQEIAAHADFIEGAENENDSGEELRLGTSYGIVDLNLQPGTKGTGPTGEKTQFSSGEVDISNGQQGGIKLDANKWYCVEAHFNGKAHEFELWIDDQEVPGLHVTDWKQGRMNWSPTYKYVKIGGQNFSGNIGQIWYDDIAIGPSRIRCAASP